MQDRSQDQCYVDLSRDQYFSEQEAAMQKEQYESNAAWVMMITSYNLGLTYLHQNDYSQAVQWFEKAADRGDANAQLHLAFLYFNGLGVEHNSVKAAELYKKAAEQGAPVGLLEDPDTYNNEQDFIKALELQYLCLITEDGTVCQSYCNQMVPLIKRRES